MSSKRGMAFGEEFGSIYGEIVEKWAKKLANVDEITEEMHKEWALDLEKALGDHISKELLKTTGQWKRVGTLPSRETLSRFAKTSVRSSLGNDMGDLLVRLHSSAKLTMKEDPEAMVAAGFLVKQLILRSGQTVAQIFDMAGDAFNATVGRFFKDKGALTGKRRWRTRSLNSRHRSLNMQEKSEGESFVIGGSTVYGPRPPGGEPALWSNCSCYLERETAGGEWV